MSFLQVVELFKDWSGDELLNIARLDSRTEPGTAMDVDYGLESSSGNGRSRTDGRLSSPAPPLYRAFYEEEDRMLDESPLRAPSAIFPRGYGHGNAVGRPMPPLGDSSFSHSGRLTPGSSVPKGGRRRASPPLYPKAGDASKWDRIGRGANSSN